LTGGLIGQSQRRLHGDRFLTGRGGYFDDLVAPGALHAAILRSPHPHARIRSVDTSRAAAAAGVRAVLSGSGAARMSGPIELAMRPADFGGPQVEVRCLAVDEALYEGQPVAAVAASSSAEAQRALELIEVDYEPLPAVTSAHDALDVVMRRRSVHGDPDAAFASAAFVVEGSIDIQRSTTVPIEPRGYAAWWDQFGESLTLLGTTQQPHPERLLLARALGIPEERVRVVAPNLGGAFGAKMRGQPEALVVALLARRAGAPVKWVESRAESFLQGAREQRHEFAAGFDESGVVRALRVRAVADVGVVGAAPGWGMSFLTSITFPTGYRIQDVDIEMTAVATNKPPWVAARGFGKEASNLVMERVMDLVARRLSLDPAQVRRANLIGATEFPYRTATGLNLDSGDYHRALDAALSSVQYEAARSEQAAARAAGRLFGVGIGFEMTPEAADIPGTMTSGFDTSTVRVSPSGGVTILTGVTSPGGGSETAIAQVVAERLGLLPEEVSVVQGDTDRCPFGFGNSSARATLVGASSALLAADDIRDKLAALASVMLSTPAESLAFSGGMVQAPSGASVALRDVAEAAYTRAFQVAADVNLPLESTRSYGPGNIDHTPDAEGRIQPYPTYSYSVHCSVVEVDRGTGVVRVLRHAVAHDCGTMINPALVEGQMLGAVAMGIGIALGEQLVYDSSGHLLTDRFKTYLLPRAADLPPIAIAHLETPSPFTLLGTKGAGEAGVGGAQAAIVNAVDDALAPLGVGVRELPLSPPRVLELMQT
jgi:carbon-monoxide dehydrogenase large subunit